MSDQADEAVAVKRGRGRSPYRMSEEHRDKIRNSNILNNLIEHVSGNREMTSTQVSAGLGLLKKCLPDLQAVTISGDDEADAINVVARIERVITSK